MSLEGINRIAWGTKLLPTSVSASLVDSISLCLHTEVTVLLFDSKWVLLPPTAPRPQ